MPPEEEDVGGGGMPYTQSFGGGVRLDFVRPFARRMSFHLRPGYFVGRGSSYGDPKGGALWVLNLDVALGIRGGPFFMSLGPSLGVSRARDVFGMSERPFPTFSGITVEVGLVVSRALDIRLGVRVGAMLSNTATAYLSFPLHRKPR